MASTPNTPMRRPARSYRNLVDEDDGSVWTTSRCQRMLRSLTSRVATIRKKHENYLSRERATIVPAHMPSTAITLNNAEGHASAQMQSNKAQEEEDPEWAPGRPATRARHTYSTRGVVPPQRSQRRPAASIGRAEYTKYGLVLATPRISASKALRAIQTPPTGGWRTSFERMSPAASRKQAKRAFYTSRSHDDILRGVEHVWDGIQSSLDTILVATSSMSEIPARQRQGTRSLFATCLSKVPRLIIGSQSALDEETEGQREDLTEEVYSDLEALSQNPKAGWRPLREVVRAHAIAILSDAVRELLIPFPRAVDWAFQCARKGCVTEGEHILEALMEVQIELKDMHAGPDDGFDAIARALKEFGSLYDREHLLWRFLGDAVSSGRKGLGWFMEPQRQYLWGKMIDPIFEPCRLESTQSANDMLHMLFKYGIAGSVELDRLAHQIRIKSNQRRSSRLVKPLRLEMPHSLKEAPALVPLHFLFLSMMDVLATVIIVRPLSGNPAIAAMRDILKQVSLLRETVSFKNASELQKCISLIPELTIVALGAFKVDLGPVPQGCSWDIAMQGSQMTDQTLDVLGRLLTLIAESCGAATSKDSKTFLRRMSRFLVWLTREGGPEDFARIAVNAAFDFAERWPKSTNLDFALEIEEEVDLDIPVKNTLRLATPNSKGHQPSFRWEESISEWVAKTPLPKAKTGSIQSSHQEIMSIGKKNTDRDSEAESELEEERKDAESVAGHEASSAIDSADEESEAASVWSRRRTRQLDSPDSSPDRSLAMTPNPDGANLSRRAMWQVAAGRKLQPQVIIPAVSKALKRCVSEPAFNTGPTAKRQKRTRLSNESANSYYLRDGRKASGMRVSARSVGKVSYVDNEESDDELGM